ncbi:hypothetical protein llap_7277 [Limosa lapponica baueri]|uniref:Uncharacterized protein n=1 Tax=Limosa lapponica baueri TaxID=1758121 RepID=A0A2I0U8P3_LIMLA|nr:hypothetical protein llap_7277 [Limosa lapponica baueri]
MRKKGGEEKEREKETQTEKEKGVGGKRNHEKEDSKRKRKNGKRKSERATEQKQARVKLQLSVHGVFKGLLSVPGLKLPTAVSLYAKIAQLQVFSSPQDTNRPTGNSGNERLRFCT